MDNATDEKELYETLDTLANNDNGDLDLVAEVLLALTGMSVHNGCPVLDPAERDDANRVALRWLRHHDYLPRGRIARIRR